MEKRKTREYRAEMKELAEQRAEFVEQLEMILGKAKEEKRAITEEESKKFDEIEQKIKDIDLTVVREQRAKELAKEKERAKEQTKEKEEQEKDPTEQEVRAFSNYVRGVISEERADVNFTESDNGAVIPASIANKIIETVKDICPIFGMATRYNVNGTLTIPYYDEEEQCITMTYADEFQELEASSGKFTSISLNGFLAGVLTKVSKRLLNNSNFDLMNFIIQKVAESAKVWIEKELLLGTEGKIDGLAKVKQVVTAKASNVLTVDELMDVQDSVPDTFQAGAIWIMNKKTRNAIRKLKDNDGNYLLNHDVSSKWGYTLLGKDIYTTDTMPTLEADKMVLYYGDMSGLAIKVAEDVNLEVLREKYATQHAIGVVAWLEMDAKIENMQKIAGLKMKATA